MFYKYLFVGVFSFVAGQASETLPQQGTKLDTNERTLKIGIVQEWTHFNPINYNLASNQALLHFFTRNFTYQAASGTPIADLVSEIPSIENKGLKIIESKGSKRAVATWKIKKEAKWGDGISVSCADFELSWKIGKSPNVSVQEKSIFTKIEHIQWDQNTPQICNVTYSLNEWAFERDLPYPVPAHLEAEVFKKFGQLPEGYDKNTIYAKEPTNKGLYNGPYIVSEFKVGSHTTLVSNPHFFGNKPYFNKITLVRISDTSNIKPQLLTGQLDMVSAVGFPPDTALLLDEEASINKYKFKVRFQDSPVFQGMFFNLENELLSDIHVRKAISMAIDKKTMVKAFFKNRLRPAETIFSPQHLAFTSHPDSYSKQKAINILESNGWQLDPTGVRVKNGKKLELIFKTSAGIKVLESIQTFICDQLKQVGIRCITKNEPPRVLLGESVPKGNFDLAMFGTSVKPDASLTSRFSSKEIPTKENSFAGQNSSRWRSKVMDETLIAFDQEWDVKKRIQLCQKMDQITRDEVPQVTLYHRREAIVMPANMHGVEDDFDGTGFVTPEKWILK